MDQLALLFVLLLGAVVMVPVGNRLGMPPPVLMTLGGAVLALLPFVPNVEVPPEFILPLVLPPLLYAAVQRTSWRQFTANLRPIFLLAVALVFATTAAVAAVAQAVVPGMPLAARRGARCAGRAAGPGRRDRRRRQARAAPPHGLDPGGRGAVQRRHRDRALPRRARRGGQRNLLRARRARLAGAVRRGRHSGRSGDRLGRQQADGAARRSDAADRPDAAGAVRRLRHGRGVPRAPACWRC